MISIAVYNTTRITAQLTKIRWSSCRYDFALQNLVRAKRGTETRTYIRPALEDNWLVAWTFTVGKCADSLGRLVRECREHVIESLVAEGF